MADTTTAVVTMGVPPPGFEINLVNPPWIGYRLDMAASICMVLSTVILGTRLLTRKLILSSMGWDDLLITFAWVFAMVLGIGDIIQTKHGCGNHMWDVTIPTFERFLVIQVVVGIAYQTSLGLAKISICLFYLRLSPHTPFRILAYTLIAFVSSYTFAGLAVIVFSCNPIAASWDLALAALPTTTCVNRPADYLAQAAFNIFTDVAIFVLPLKMVWGLSMPFKQRLAVTVVFATGLFVCVVSMIRLQSVIQVLQSTDLSYDTVGILVWSTIESHVTIVCACIPTLKPLISHFFPRLWGGSNINTNTKSMPNNIYNSTTYPKSDGITRELHKLDSENDPIALSNYKKWERSKTNTTVIAGQDPRFDTDNESQEIFLGAQRGRGKVVVTHTVDVQ